MGGGGQTHRDSVSHDAPAESAIAHGAPHVVAPCEPHALVLERDILSRGMRDVRGRMCIHRCKGENVHSPICSVAHRMLSHPVFHGYLADKKTPTPLGPYSRPMPRALALAPHVVAPCVPRQATREILRARHFVPWYARCKRENVHSVRSDTDILLRGALHVVAPWYRVSGFGLRICG